MKDLRSLPDETLDALHQTRLAALLTDPTNDTLIAAVVEVERVQQSRELA